MAPIVIPMVYGRSEQKKAQEKAQEAANQQAEQSRAEQQRLEQKYNLTPGELSSEENIFNQYNERSRKTGEELIRSEGPVTNTLADKIQGRQNMSGRDLFLSEGGPAAQQYADRIEAPGAQDTFGPELELVRQMVNAEANRRGVFGGLPEGGIRFEQLGRAGVDLAIKSARESLAQKAALTQSYVNMSQNARAEAGTFGERALTSSERARAELDQFLNRKNQSDQNATFDASSIGQRGTEMAYNTNQDIYGQQAGRGAAYEKFGLETLGEVIGLGAGAATGGMGGGGAASMTGGSSQLLAGGNTSLRTRGSVDESLLADQWTNTRRRY